MIVWRGIDMRGLRLARDTGRGGGHGVTVKSDDLSFLSDAV